MDPELCFAECQTLLHHPLCMLPAKLLLCIHELITKLMFAVIADVWANLIFRRFRDTYQSSDVAFCRFALGSG